MPTPAANTTKARNRLAKVRRLLKFSRERGNTFKDRFRLFYSSAIKPGLVFRGLDRYEPAKIVDFSIRAAPDRLFKVRVRDNHLDMVTFAEFFSSQHVVIPTELPPMQPKVIYDIGANIGIASLYLAGHYPKARFYGFEPVPANHQICVANYGNLPSGQAFPWAVGARSGSAVFEFSENDLRGGRLESNSQSAAGGLGNRLEVEVVSIEDLVLKKQFEPPDFLKIDVEGAELEVLKGIGTQAVHIKRMLIETHGPELKKQCLAWLQEHDFTVLSALEAAPGYAALWADRR